MPLMVNVEVDPNFEAKTADEKAALKLAQTRGTFETDYTNALEAVRNSRGLYRIASTEPSTPAPASATRALEDMDNDELKQMMLVAGITPQKQMKRQEIIKAIRLKLDAVQIVDDENDAEN